MILIFRFFLFSTLIAISILAVVPDYSALPPVVSFSDLLNHTIAFITLSFLYRIAYNHTVRRIILSLIAYAVMIEIVQLFLPTRFGSLEDILADSVGILVGLVLARGYSVFARLGRIQD